MYNTRMNRKLARSALIAAVYVILSLAFAPLSYGVVQFRVSEVLTLLPFFMGEATWGLFVGCFLANVLGGMGPWDVFGGSAATLVAALLSARSPNIYWAAAWPVVVNALAVGGYLSMLTGIPLLLTIAYIAAGQFGVCVVVGIPLCVFLNRRGLLIKNKI